MSRNLTPEEKKAWILENCIDDDGNIDLSELDFSDFNGIVNTSHMKVKVNLRQHAQQVEGDLDQSYQEVKGYLYQDEQKVQGDLFQNSQKVKGNLFQSYQ